MMAAEKLFSSEERGRVVELLLYQAEGELKVRALARTAKVSPALVSCTIAILKKGGAVKGDRIDPLHPSVKAIKIMLNMEKIESTRLIQTIRMLFKDCGGMGLYGSWANGTNSKDSDLDLWAKTESGSDEKIIRLRRIIKQKIGVEANIIVLTKKRLKELKENDFVFYCALHNSFVLWGEGI